MPRMRACAHCKEGFELAATGRPPTYCSATCRKAAWDARRVQAAVDEAVEAERQRANRGNETANRGNETGKRGNETRQDPLPTADEEEWVAPIGAPWLRMRP